MPSDEKYITFIVCLGREPTVAGELTLHEFFTETPRIPYDEEKLLNATNAIGKIKKRESVLWGGVRCYAAVLIGWGHERRILTTDRQTSLELTDRRNVFSPIWDGNWTLMEYDMKMIIRQYVVGIELKLWALATCAHMRFRTASKFWILYICDCVFYSCILLGAPVQRAHEHGLRDTFLLAENGRVAQ